MCRLCQSLVLGNRHEALGSAVGKSKTLAHRPKTAMRKLMLRLAQMGAGSNDALDCAAEVSRDDLYPLRLGVIRNPIRGVERLGAHGRRVALNFAIWGSGHRRPSRRWWSSPGASFI